MSQSKLKDILLENIVPNPANPRIVFRQEEMDQLLISIKKYGVQVPVTVYEHNSRYVLIDGERRWRTCRKLNLRTIPALIQSKPTELENLLMMFNIHSLREQWDLFTIANKLSVLIRLLAKNLGIPNPSEAQISEATGLTRSTIRRCKLLIELPEKYKLLILKELEKPKPRQKITEDFFIEMESCLKTVRRNMPDLLTQADRVRDNLIKKFQSGVINNIVHFRHITKIATSPKNLEYPASKAKSALQTIFEDNSKSIEEIYSSTVASLYDEQKIISTIKNATTHIEQLTDDEMSDAEIINALKQLHAALAKILDEYE